MTPLSALHKHVPKTILFDADGVVQWPKADRRAMWATLLRDRDDLVESFFRALLDLERTCYLGQRNFLAALPGLLTQWDDVGTIDDLLRAWTAIEVNGEIVEIVGSLRAAGIQGCLATNQEPYRGRYMSQTLDYGTVFDQQFYSCELGLCKPDPEFFVTILERLGRSPQEVLFIDDREANITAAAGVGLHVETFTPPSGTSPADEMRRVLGRHGFSAVV